MRRRIYLPAARSALAIGLLTSSIGLAGGPVEVKAMTEIDGGPGGLPLPDQSWFGYGATFLPDLDNDGIGELAVGSIEVNLSGKPGSVWILLLNDDGTVKSHVHITDGSGGLPAGTVSGKRFGVDITWLGDLGPNAPTPYALAVGQSHGLSSTGQQTGAIWILFLEDSGGTPGNVFSHVKLTNGSGGLSSTLLDPSDGFGNGVGSLPDLNGDGVRDLAVGAPGDDDGVPAGVDDQAGAVWVLFLKDDGSAVGSQKISALHGGGPSPLIDHEYFGDSIGYLGDLGSGAPTPHAVAVGSTFGNDFSALGKGNVRILFLNGPGTSPGTVNMFTTLQSGTNGLPNNALGDGDHFGRAVAAPGDLNGDGIPDLAIGAQHTDDGAADAGAIWLACLTSTGTIQPGNLTKVSATESCFGGDLKMDDRFGESIAAGDFNNDGFVDLAIGASKDDADVMMSDRGSTWMTTVVPCGPASWSNYGSGSMGSLCVPTLTLSAEPVLGTVVNVVVDNCFSPTLSTVGLLFVGTQQVSIPGYGGTLLVAPILVIQELVGPTKAAIPIPIPCDTVLCGVEGHFQFIQADPGVPAGASWTPGLTMVFGK